jgi:hypothetical protein
MKMPLVVIASVVNLVACAPAFAHGDHPSSHGGIMGRGDDTVIVEFVVEKGTLTVYVHDEDGNALPLKDVSATLTLAAPHSLPQEVKLVRVGPDKFTAPDMKPATGDRLRARIKLPSGQEAEALGLYAK